MTRILSVDDSAPMRDLVALTLTQAGYEVAQAKDGVEALSMARVDNFDLVLADLYMPNMNGIELIRALRAEANYRMTPILMLATESDLAMRREGKAAGATGWIVKPFFPDQLVASLNRALR
jgi:two-component system chemotaxis response regulator CheY